MQLPQFVHLLGSMMALLSTMMIASTGHTGTQFSHPTQSSGFTFTATVGPPLDGS